MCLDRIDCEKDSKIYVDLNNKKKFIDDYLSLQDILEVKIGAYDLEETINQFLSNNSVRNLDPKIEIEKKFNIIEGFNTIDSFFKEKNKSRILNRTDFRHCVNHPKFIKGKSHLIDGLGGFDNAEVFLSSAIGDAKTKRAILINVDKHNNDFILRYEDENFNNRYHAYHIVESVGGKYIVDTQKLQLINNSRKGIPRAYKLIMYRENLS
jgi:hypothetical protein